jgi:hypothetical protein
MYGVLMSRADALRGCRGLTRIVNALEAYETKRWPEGKEAGGKGRDRRTTAQVLDAALERSSRFRRRPGYMPLVVVDKSPNATARDSPQFRHTLTHEVPGHPIQEPGRRAQGENSNRSSAMASTCRPVNPSNGSAGCGHARSLRIGSSASRSTPALTQLTGRGDPSVRRAGGRR